MTTRPTFIRPADQSAATVTIAAQTDRSALTPHALTATLGGGATAVLWSSSTGTFDNAASLTPTYTPTTIGIQEVVCTPSGALGVGAPASDAWLVSRPVPVVASSLGSTEELAGATYAPTLSETAGADAPATPWLTTALLVEDGSSVSVTGSTTPTPSFGSIAVGAAYRVIHQYTDVYGRVAQLSVGVRRTPGAGADNLTVSLSTGDTVNQASPGGQVITATPSGGTGAKTYLWSATYINSGTSADALLSSTTAANPTLTTTAYAQHVFVKVVVTDSGSPAQTATAAVGVTVALTPIVFSNPVAQSSATAGAATVTFTAATGGTGTLVYGVATLSVPTGSAATLSGSGLGPFTFTTDVSGAYGVTQSVTDDLGVSSQATGVVAYTPTGPTWSVVGALINWTSCTTASRSSAGTLAIYEQDGTTLKATITAAATGSPTGVVGCTDGVGLYSTYTSGAGSLWAVAPIGAPSSASKKIAVQSIVNVSTLSALERAVGASNTLAPVGNTQNFVMFDKPAANYRATVTNRVSNVNATVVALSQASSFGTYLCVTVINDGKQQSVYVNTATSTTDFTPMDALTGGTNIVPRYDSSALGTTPAVYARTYSSAYQAVYAYSAGGATGTAIVTASRLLEASAES